MIPGIEIKEEELLFLCPYGHNDRLFVFMLSPVKPDHWHFILRCGQCGVFFIGHAWIHETPTAKTLKPNDASFQDNTGQYHNQLTFRKEKRHASL